MCASWFKKKFFREVSCECVQHIACNVDLRPGTSQMIQIMWTDFFIASFCFFRNKNVVEINILFLHLFKYSTDCQITLCISANTLTEDPDIRT